MIYLVGFDSQGILHIGTPAAPFCDEAWPKGTIVIGPSLKDAAHAAPHHLACWDHATLLLEENRL